MGLKPQIQTDIDKTGLLHTRDTMTIMCLRRSRSWATVADEEDEEEQVSTD